MNCSKCNSYVASEDAFCGVCGTKVNNQNEYPQQSNIGYITNGYPEQLNTGYKQSENLGEWENISTPNNESNQFSDEDLIDAYIGNNAKEIKSGKFSWCAFWLGLYYLLYRKMWVLAALVFAIAFISGIFLTSFSSVILLGTSIFLGIKFNELYLKNATDEVNKIKFENSAASREELIKCCKKKGGTTIIPVILLIVGCFIIGIIVAVVIVASALYTFNNIDDKDIISTLNYGDISNIQTFSVQNGYEGYFASVPKPELDFSWTEETQTKLTDWSSGDDKAYTLTKKFTNSDTEKIDAAAEKYKELLLDSGFELYKVSYNHYTYIKDDISVEVYAGYDYIRVALDSGYQAAHM